MSQNGRTPKDSVVDDAILYVNLPITDGDFGKDVFVSKSDKEGEPNHPRKMTEEIYEFKDPVNSESDSKKKRYPNGMKSAFITYIKRNVVVLSVLVLLWLILGVDYLYTTYRIPVIGGIISFFNQEPLGSVLRYITATRSGPMSFGDFMKPTFAGYLAAFVGKPLYILSLTGILIPLITGVFKKNKTIVIPFSNNISLLKSTLKAIPSKINTWGLLLMGSGFALILSNIVTRNGKLDKSFMPLLLTFVIFAGLSTPLPALIDYIIRKFLGMILRFLPKGLDESFEKMVLLKTGMIVGLLVSLPTSQIAERANYSIGTILLLAGAILSLFYKKEIPHEL